MREKSGIGAALNVGIGAVSKVGVGRQEERRRVAKFGDSCGDAAADHSLDFKIRSSLRCGHSLLYVLRSIMPRQNFDD